MSDHLAHLRTNVVSITPHEPRQPNPYWTWLFTLLIDCALWAFIIVVGLAFLRGDIIPQPMWSVSQPDVQVEYPGPVTTIGQQINATALQIATQFPQSYNVPNTQGTLYGYANTVPDPARLIIWSPLTTPWLTPTGPVTITIPEVPVIPPVVPDVPEVGTWQLVSGALLVLSGWSKRRRK